MSKRPKVPQAIENDVLLRSGRRCCLCVGLNGDTGVKPGQIAHLDNDPSNNDVSNLAYLCLQHHDQYDTRTSQSKGLTIREVQSYRNALYANLPSYVNAEHRAGDVSVSGDIAAGDGLAGPGGRVVIKGGTGRQGASGGNVTIGPGNVTAGQGGAGGPGGDIVIKGGDAE